MSDSTTSASRGAGAPAGAVRRTRAAVSAVSPVSGEVQQVLQTIFSMATLRYGQAEAIAATLAGRDVLACLATGAGKSLCYQLPAVVLRARGAGPTWVVSPLVALMEDQTRALRARGVRALALHAQLSDAARKEAWAKLSAGDYDLVYLAPERALLPHVLALARRQRAALLAIDEAHCVSAWGHDFRPEYRKLAELRLALGAPTVAVTATATAEVARDVVQTLGLSRPLLLRGPVTRKNLHFVAEGPATRPARLARLVAALQQAPDGRRLVYAATRAMAEATAKHLAKADVGDVVLYHAGLSEAARRRAQAAYAEAKGTPPLLVATPAFGMGIDQPDVRLVVHVQAPGSPEAYYQEAGRAGRDGNAARCLLLWGNDDWPLQRRLASGGAAKARARAAELLAAMQRYTAERTCRQQHFARYFGAAATGDEAHATCGHCDACAGTLPEARPSTAGKPAAPPPSLDAAERARLERTVVVFAQGLRRPVGATLLAQALRGSRSKLVLRRGLTKLPFYGALQDTALPHVLAAVTASLEAGTLEPRGRKYPTVWPAGRAVRPARAPRGERPPTLTAQLARYGRRKARELGWKKPYLVLSRKLMAAIAAARPSSHAELATVVGMGPSKLQRFGEEILQLVQKNGAQR